MTENKKMSPASRRASPGKLQIKRTVETGQVRQNFSHGRSKMVTVEVKKKRTYAKNAEGRLAEVEAKKDQSLAQPEAPSTSVFPTETEKAVSPEPSSKTSGAGGTLTEAEKIVRAKALEEARKQSEREAVAEAKKKTSRKQKSEEEANDQALPSDDGLDVSSMERNTNVSEEQILTESEETNNGEVSPVKEEPEKEDLKKASPKTKKKSVTTSEKSAKSKGDAPEETAGDRSRPSSDVETLPLGQEVSDLDTRKARSDAGDGHFRKGKSDKKEEKDLVKKGDSLRRTEDRRRHRGKLTISKALSEDGEGKRRSLASIKRARDKGKQKREANLLEAKKIVRDVTIPEMITVQELSSRMAERSADVIKSLMKMGVMATLNQSIDADTAELVVEEFGHKVVRIAASDVEIGLRGGEDNPEHMKPRPPVVTIMGHVDHGKTSLLDALRETDVATRETGGITQHIGAYQVVLESGAKISFVDTPGHAAFTQMRARGAKITDIVVLVVAADDGIMPQTVEAINHAKAAEVPIIIAINKIDLPEANPANIRTELLQHDVVLEEMGGEVLSVEISAKKKTNLDKLEEVILLQAELLDLKANPDRTGEGIVLESRIERGQGNVATVLVQRGTLRKGDIFVAGAEWGKVRALVDHRGQRVEAAYPAMPVELLGLNGTPQPGDEVFGVENENRAREVTSYRQQKNRDARIVASARGSLEQMFDTIKEGIAKKLSVIIKGDVHGSVEAIEVALKKISTEEVELDVLHAGVGGVNESDITLAQASKALVIAFNVRANPQARELARRDNIQISYYSIIYDVVDDMKKMLSGMMAPVIRESFLGYAEIREVFSVSKVGKIAGCMVTEGLVKRGCKMRLLRDDVIIHEGELNQLKRFKDDVQEVSEGYECGMALQNYQDIRQGDRIECFQVEEVERKL